MTGWLVARRGEHAPGPGASEYGKDMNEKVGGKDDEAVSAGDLKPFGKPVLCPPARVDAGAGDGPFRPSRKRKLVYFRNHAEEQTSEAFPDIVKKLVDKARDGSINHTRLLFDVAGISEASKAGSKGKSRSRSASLAKMILDAERKRDAKQAPQAENAPDPEEEVSTASLPGQGSEGEGTI
ncbi:MAG TPA: hypothetical protein VGD59_13570 [Acidisarcina sp.]